MKRTYTLNFRKWLRAATLGLATWATATSAWANNSYTTYTFDIGRTAGQTEASQCPLQSSVLMSHLGVSGSLTSALASSTIKTFGVQLSSGKFYAAYTNGSYGYTFTNKGIVTKKDASAAAIRTQAYLGAGQERLDITTVDKNLAEGQTYTVKQAFVNPTTADTVVYAFNIVMGATAYVKSNVPAFIHRADKKDAWLARPYMRQNEQEPVYDNCLQVNAGDQVTLGMRAKNEGESVKFSIISPSGKTLKYTNDKDYVLAAVEPEDAGAYTVKSRLTMADGKFKSETYTFILDVQTNQGAFYDWKAETPYWSYDFRDEYPNGFPTPTKVHTFYKKNGQKANQEVGEWWSAFWGDDLNSEVDQNNKNAFTNMMKKYDKDFAYIRDEMGWPPDINARKGYKSFVYVFGSGLANDNTPKTEKGGYQSMTSADGSSWPCVWASYYPVSRFRDDADSKWSDGDYQREAMIHEGIHAIFADMNGVKNSAWFHEGGNTWLQSAMNSKRDNVYGTPGFLDACPFIAPFMPIECYSGWLQDGSFGGPSAEGVDMYNSEGEKICTWRSLLGGTQYGNGFAIFLGEAIGQGTIPWIWRYCKNRVLEGIADGNKAENIPGIGDEGMRKLIMQYRAKQATFDIGGFANGYRAVMDGNFGGTTKPEWEPYWINVAPFKLTPYQQLTVNDAEGWLAPDTITNPGWSGGNILPIHVGNNGCEIYFRPEDANMRAQLCYRTKSGERYYSQPVLCGKLKLSWDESNKPANGVVFCVVANTDYRYINDATRKKHYDYRIKLGEGALAPASKDIRWYFYEKNLKDNDFETGINSTPTAEAKDGHIRLLSTTLHGGSTVQFDLGSTDPTTVTAHLVGASGIVIDEQKLSSDSSIQLPSNLRKGMYILSLHVNGKITSSKIFVE